LFVVKDPQNEETLFGSVVLAVNQGGVITFNEEKINSDDQAYQKLTGDGTEVIALSDYPAQYASFFDFDELG